MGTLTGKQIRNLVTSGNLVINPLDDSLIQPATLDLRLHFKVLASPLGEDIPGKVVDLRDCPEGFNILPGQMVGVLSLERLELPLNISGRFGIR